MPELPSNFETELVGIFLTHLPDYQPLIGELRVYSREHDDSGFLTHFGCNSKDEAWCLSLDDEIVLEGGLELDAELRFRERQICGLRVWNRAGPWDGDLSVGYRFDVA